MSFKEELQVNPRLLLALLLGAILVLLVACTGDNGTDTSGDGDRAPATTTGSDLVFPASVAEAMRANQTPFVVTAASLNAIDVDLANAADPAQGIEADRGTVTITKPGAYRLHGTLNGRLVITIDDGHVDLILDGISITSDVPGALWIEDGDQVVLHLVEGSSNTITDAWNGAELHRDHPNAALYSEADLGITGTGTLTVTGAIDGIASTDGLVIDDGNIVVNADDDAVRGKDYLVISGGTLVLDAGSDAMKSTEDSDSDEGYVWISGGTVNAIAGTDCVDAATDVLISGGQLSLDCGDDGLHGEALLLIDGGEIDISRSLEGLEAPVLVIAGGIINVVSSDDGLNAAGGDDSDAPDTQGSGIPDNRPGDPKGDPTKYALVITGGTLTVNAGGDGMDSNGSMTITGGETIIYGPTHHGDGALDSSGLTIAGGRLLAVGSSGMAETPTQATQAWIGAAFDAPAGATITVADTVDSGNAWNYTIPKASQFMVFSTPELVSGREYSISVDTRTVDTVIAR